MIHLYSGTPGSGKSLKAAYKLIFEIERGRTVIANFPIDEQYFDKRKKKKKPLGKFIYLDNQELTVDALMFYALFFHTQRREHQTLIIIDECAAMFNSRSWDKPDRQKWIKFFQQHRKLGFDIILISQQDRLIDRQIRAFIETEYKFRALKNYRMFGWFISTITGGMFIAVEYWYGTRLWSGKEIFLLHRKKARIYDTYKIFS